MEKPEVAVTEEGLTAAALPVGAAAPGFALERAPEQTVALADFRDRPVVVAFYPGDWTAVCNDQLVDLTARLGAFHRRGAAVLGISVDSAWSHQAFAEARQIGFPLLADFHPKGEVARAYGVYADDWGIAHRALFLVDTQGVVRWRRVDLQRLIAERFGVAYHERTVGKILHQLGFRHISARRRHPAQDERIVAEFKKTSPVR